MKLLPTALIIGIIGFTSCNMPVDDKSNESLLDLTDSKTQAIKSLEEDSSATTASKKSSTIHYGIDVSHYQGDILSKLNNTDSIQFAICKATQGKHFVDPEFHYNWRESKEKGLIRGTYHFYDCSVDPIIQANHFVNTVQSIESSDIAPILDIEQGSMKENISSSQMVKDVKTFLTLIEKKLGRKPIIYTGYDFAQEHFTGTGLNQYKLWLAEYTSSTQPKIPTEWEQEEYFIWQKSQNYHDHSTQLDYDEYIGDLGDLTSD